MHDGRQDAVGADVCLGVGVDGEIVRRAQGDGDGGHGRLQQRLHQLHLHPIQRGAQRAHDEQIVRARFLAQAGDFGGGGRMAGDKFIDVPGFATEKFITDKFPVAYSNAAAKEALTWTADGFRNKSFNYVSQTDFDLTMPSGTPAAGSVLEWDADNKRIVPVTGFAKATDIADRS